MQASEIQQFFDIWDDRSRAYEKPLVDSDTKTIAFKMLLPYSLNEIRQALNRHIADPSVNQYIPRAPDIIRMIQRYAQNQFPGPEQAWAMFPRDEALSACICDEMAAAWGVASEQDEISGRMVFKEKYSQEVAKAQAEGRQPRWFITCGHDKQHREQVALDAVRDSLISPESAQAHLPHIPLVKLQQLATKEVTTNKLLEAHAQTVDSVGQLLLSAPDEGLATIESSKAHIADIKDLLGMRSEPEPPETDLEKFKAQAEVEMAGMRKLAAEPGS